MSILSWFLGLFRGSHVSAPPKPDVSIVANPVQNAAVIGVVPDASIAVYRLSWESDPTRKAWSDYLVNQVLLALPTLRAAKDLDRLCPNFLNLGTVQQAYLISEMFCSTAKYESGWDPTSSEVDVGSKDDKDTWSVGLLQLSVCDQESYGLPFGFVYNDLLSPFANIKLGVAIMSKIVVKTGVMFVPWSDKRNVYWATLSEGNRYCQLPHILSDVSSLRALMV